MVSVGGGSGCEVSIVISYKPSGLFLVPFSTVVLSEFKMVTSFFVRSAKQLESHSCLIESMLALLIFVYAGACVDVDSKIMRSRCPEIFGLIIELSGRWTLGPVVVGTEFFKIMVSCPMI